MLDLPCPWCHASIKMHIFRTSTGGIVQRDMLKRKKCKHFVMKVQFMRLQGREPASVLLQTGNVQVISLSTWQARFSCMDRSCQQSLIARSLCWKRDFVRFVAPVRIVSMSIQSGLSCIFKCFAGSKIFK